MKSISPENQQLTKLQNKMLKVRRYNSMSPTPHSTDGLPYIDTKKGISKCTNWTSLQTLVKKEIISRVWRQKNERQAKNNRWSQPLKREGATMTQNYKRSSARFVFDWWIISLFLCFFLRKNVCSKDSLTLLKI
jgi:hypothetical protein